MKLSEMTKRQLYAIFEKEGLDVANQFEEYIELSELKEEFERRKLPLPIAVIPAPKTIIMFPLDIQAKPSRIIQLDTKKTGDNLEHYKEHPLQAIVVAYDHSIEWPELYLGATLYLKNGEAGILRYNDVSYRFVNYSSIICIK
jgi:hypothetical protein